MSTSYNTLPTSFSLTISPTRLAIAASDIPGSHTILVVNRGQSPVGVTVQKQNFTGAADGSLSFDAAAPYSASSWVAVAPTAFILQPGRSQEVTATITVPVAPEPGDHQVALVFLVPAGSGGANIKINRGVATPVYIAVPGVSDDSASVSNLHGPGFSAGGHATLTATVHGTGTVHRDFRGTAPLRLSASGVGTAFPDFTVLRAGTRDVSTTWDPPFMCVCHVSLTIDNGVRAGSTASITVVVFPWPLLLLVLAALLIVWLGFVLVRRRYRSQVTRAATRMIRPVGSGDA